MYILDCLYGNIEFSQKVIQCMLSPEMQRLREVRLGNINSLFLTGISNTNRFEHSVGTAYLATVNVGANKEHFRTDDKRVFVYAALFHDLANGPFGHSYEYFVEKQGFTPEESISDVIFGKTTGSHRKTSTLEPFFLGEPNELSSLLKKDDINLIDQIVRGDRPACSKLLSDSIDIDNIDNVYRMAFHMGIQIDRRIPIELAKGMFCEDGTVYFKNNTVPYVFDWYDKRRRVYQYLLYNPQDFAAKCMMAETLDIVLTNTPSKIKWHFTDSEFVEAMLNMKEGYWNDVYVPIITEKEILLKDFLCPSKIKTSMKSFGIEIPENANIRITQDKEQIEFVYYNTTYLVTKGRLYKKIRNEFVPAKTITRLMRGDLYSCIGIFVTKQTEKYSEFFSHEMRRALEIECEKYIELQTGTKEYSICFHAILDKHKTKRALNIKLEGGEVLSIGENSNELLIGAFLKNCKYGLSKGGVSEKKRERLCSLVSRFLLERGINCIEHELYREVKDIE